MGKEMGSVNDILGEEGCREEGYRGGGYVTRRWGNKQRLGRGRGVSLGVR